MTSVFKGRSFLAEKDFTKEELQYLIDFSQHLKGMKANNQPHRYLDGKNIALLFEKNSTRARRPLRLRRWIWGHIRNF